MDFSWIFSSFGIDLAIQKNIEHQKHFNRLRAHFVLFMD